MLGRTLVAGPYGPKRIDEFQPDDWVWSRDDDGGQLVKRRIVAAWQSADQETYRLRLAGRNVDASANRQFLRISRAGTVKRLVRVGEWQPEGGQPDPAWHRDSLRIVGQGQCGVTTCRRPLTSHESRGMCGTCYARWRKHGDPTIVQVNKANYAAEWVPLEQLRRGDLIVVLDQSDDLGDDTPVLPDATPVTEDVAWLLGAIVGDGTVTEKAIRVAAFGEFREHVATRFARIWDLHGAPHPTAGLIVNSTAVASMLLHLGFVRRGADKRVPKVAWDWSQRLQLAFCGGYAAADGSRGRDGLAHHSCSRRLIDEVRTIHLQAGHRLTNVRTNNRDKPITIKGKRVKDAKPLHSFVVSSIDREPYTRITTPTSRIGPKLYRQLVRCTRRPRY